MPRAIALSGGTIKKCLTVCGFRRWRPPSDDSVGEVLCSFGFATEHSEQPNQELLGGKIQIDSSALRAKVDRHVGIAEPEAKFPLRGLRLGILRQLVDGELNSGHC